MMLVMAERSGERGVRIVQFDRIEGLQNCSRKETEAGGRGI